MPKGVLIYLSFHEPRRLRLPAVPVAGDRESFQNLRDWIVDRRSTEQHLKIWAEEIGKPYARLLRQLMADGARFMINVSGPLFEMLAAGGDRSVSSFITMLRHSKVAFVCSEAKHSLSCYLDVDQFTKQTRRTYDLAQRQGITPAAAVAPQMCFSADIYYALARLPLPLIVADGCHDILGGRSSGFFRRNGWGPIIITRDSELSLRITSMLNSPPEPLFELHAAEIAQQVAESDGDCVLLGWQVTNRTDKNAVEGGLRFLECLCGELLRGGLRFVDIRKMMTNDRLSSTSVPLPTTPAVSAEYGSVSYFLGHPVQQQVFGLMQQAYSVAQLSRKEQIVDHALDLAQWDLLSLIHRILMSNGHSQEPEYLTAEQWSQLGGAAVVGEIQTVLEKFIESVTASCL